MVVLLVLDWWFDFSAVMALMAPDILIGGMTLGLFTPTEAAVAAVLWSLFLGLVRYRSMTWNGLAKATFDTIGAGHEGKFGSGDALAYMVDSKKGVIAIGCR